MVFKQYIYAKGPQTRVWDNQGTNQQGSNYYYNTLARVMLTQRPHQQAKSRHQQDDVHLSAYKQPRNMERISASMSDSKNAMTATM